MSVKIEGFPPLTAFEIIWSCGVITGRTDENGLCQGVDMTPEELESFKKEAGSARVTLHTPRPAQFEVVMDVIRFTGMKEVPCS